MLDNRASLLRALLDEEKLDALVLIKPENLYYFCGFTGSSGVLIVTDQERVFLTDSRYSAQAQQEVSAEVRIEYAVQSDGILAALNARSLCRVGYEADYLTCAALERLCHQGGERLTWVSLTRPLHLLRGIKEEAEIVVLERAALLASRAFEEILPLCSPGRSEREIALALEFAMRRQGGDEKSFDLIVASGERGALPHGTASHRQLKSGEFVTIDFGLRLDGYCSDETVTLAIGSIDEELRQIYTTVYRAQQLAMAAIRPGVPLKEIDAVARDVIAAAGYGPYFGHGLGHGVGLEVHEYPTLSPRSVDVAESGMVFTVEPGIYVPGKGGVRLEDMVVVTAEGFRKLTCIPKELQHLH